MKFKKIFFLIIGILLICTNIFGLSNYTQFENNNNIEVFGWYTIPSKNNNRPPLPKEADYLDKYDAYYLGEDEKVIYLTFDAGYSNENLIKILDTLKEKNVKGSFFLNGGIFKYDQEIVKRISDEGHLVCNHTENHKNLSKISDFETYKYEIEKVEERFKELTGKEIAKFIRPPEGELNEKSLEYNQKLGYKTILWSLAYADWDNNNQMSQDKAIKTVLDRTHNGAVVLLHPTSKTNSEILGTLIDTWRNSGYEFKTVDCL